MGVRISHIRDLGEELSGGDWDVVVVIDVIRAFTVAPWVLRQGARRLLLAANAEAAVSARDARFPEALLLKDGAPDPRFDLPNAPGRIALVNLSGRIVIQATGNGTRAAHEVSEAPQVLCASFVNAGATAAVLAGHERIRLVPTEGDEDHALADYVAALIGGETPDPGPYLERVVASAAGVECRVRGDDPAFPGVHADDLDRCREINGSTTPCAWSPTASFSRSGRFVRLGKAGFLSALGAVVRCLAERGSPARPAGREDLSGTPGRRAPCRHASLELPSTASDLVTSPRAGRRVKPATGCPATGEVYGTFCRTATLANEGVTCNR